MEREEIAGLYDIGVHGNHTVPSDLGINHSRDKFERDDFGPDEHPTKGNRLVSVIPVQRRLDANYSESFLSALKALHRQDCENQGGGVQVVATAPTNGLVLPDYRNNHLVRRLMSKMELTREAAEQLFKDMLIYLTICGAYPKRPFPPTRLIDEAWHHFILFTKDYQFFCRVYFGRFIHHQPHLQADWNTPVDRNTHGESFETCASIAREHFGELSSNWSVSGGLASSEARSMPSPEVVNCLRNCSGCRTDCVGTQ